METGEGRDPDPSLPTPMSNIGLTRRSLMRCGTGILAAALPTHAWAADEDVSPVTAQLSKYMSEAGGRALPEEVVEETKAAGRFGKQDFVYVAADDVYRCPAGEMLTYRYTNEKDGKTLRRYWTSACRTCALKARCTPGKERRISRWEHEAVLETVQDRLDRNPDKMRVRRQTVEHPFGIAIPRS